VPEETDSYGVVTARYYDGAYRALRGQADAAFYRELAHEAAGPVLELGCGTGRVLLPIAADGIPCTGLDRSPAMLKALRAKQTPATLRLVNAPMQDFDLGSDRFTLIFSAFRAFQHMYTVEDQLGCLACVRRHLAPGGAFAFDVFNPRLDRIGLRSSPEVEEVRYELDGDEVVRYAAAEREPEVQLTHVHMRYERWRDGRVVGEERVSFDMRHFFRYELEHLLARAGFDDVTIYGDFDRCSVAQDTPAFVVIAR
jgi:SAM-dependent methyltransferase